MAEDFSENSVKGAYEPCMIESVNLETNIVMVSRKKKEGKASLFQQFPLFLDEELINSLYGFLGKNENETIVGCTVYCVIEKGAVIQLATDNKTFRQYLLEE